MPEVSKTEVSKASRSHQNGDKATKTNPGELDERSMMALKILARKYPVVELTMAEAGFEFPKDEEVMLDEIRYGSTFQYRLGDKEVRAFERAAEKEGGAEGERGGNKEHQEKMGNELDEQQREQAQKAIEQEKHDFPERYKERGKGEPSEEDDDDKDDKDDKKSVNVTVGTAKGTESALTSKTPPSTTNHKK